VCTLPVFRLTHQLIFPPPALASPEGLLAVGGDLSVERLLLAYTSGIFPWFSRGEPVLWWSPDPRMVLFPKDFHAPRSLLKAVKRLGLSITTDTAFAEVMKSCAMAPRPGQDGTWITRSMRDAYQALHEAGYAHSIEAWHDGELVGGLYGVAVGRFFAGESMFARRSEASKVAFFHAMQWLMEQGCALVDCQVHTAHLERFGAVEIPREDYLAALAPAVAAGPFGPARWTWRVGQGPSDGASTA
jgi:leucyl/phenylalanyl-tRNA--protein transferase